MKMVKMIITRVIEIAIITTAVWMSITNKMKKESLWDCLMTTEEATIL